MEEEKRIPERNPPIPRLPGPLYKPWNAAFIAITIIVIVFTGWVWNPELGRWVPLIGFIIVTIYFIFIIIWQILTPDLDEWLSSHPRIRAAIVWEASTGAIAYSLWSDEQKAELKEAFFLACWHNQISLEDPLPNAKVLADTDEVVQELTTENAWKFYIATIGHCLALEARNWLPWSLYDYTDEQLSYLLDSRWFFHWSSDLNHYEIKSRTHGKALPAAPVFLWNFLGDNTIRPSFDYDTHSWSWTAKLDSIVAIIEWARTYMIHGPSGDALLHEQTWRYRGYPPVKAMIEGSEWHGDIKPMSGGCWGASGFFWSLLRNLNIPFLMVTCGHSQPHFASEGLYLSHGDDIYTGWIREHPLPFNLVELLIDQTTYDAWFPPGSGCGNVGRRPTELAVQYLVLPLLRFYCNDIAAGNSHADGEVADRLSSVYTLAELEAMNLWDRMDDKIATLGGCGSIPYF